MRKTFFILSLTASFATTCLAQGSHSPKGNTTAKERDTTSLMMHDLLTPARYQPHVSGSALNNLQAIQDQRGVVNYYWQKDNPTPKDLDTASAMLHDLLAFQDSSLSYVTEAYSTHLIYKKQDLYGDLMRTYIHAGKTDSAMYIVEKMFELGTDPAYIPFLLKFEKDTSINADPRFMAIMRKFKQQEDLHSSAAFKTPYKPELTEEEKIAGLSLLWSQAKNSFVNFDHTDIDWNQSYLEYLKKIKETKTTAEYYRLMQMFYAQLKDGHTNVYPPKELMKDFYSRPPLYTALIEGRVFIRDVYSDSLKGTGIIPGLEILKIDNEPVMSYAEKYVKPYQSSSTPQDMEVREFSYYLLCGPENKSLVLELKDRKGRVFTKTISRTGYSDVKHRPSMEYQNIDGIGYLTINNFEDRKITKQFDSLFADIATTRGLVIDIRNNGGGDSYLGDKILSKLTNKPFEAFKYRALQPTTDAGGNLLWVEGTDRVQPDGRLYYSKPMVLLVSACTFSAAEDFTVAFDYMKRGKLIGQPTGGSTGQPISFDLPGGGSARYCSKKETYPDGKEFVGIGIIPDIVMQPTIKDLQNGADAVKNKAIELLRQ